MDLRSRCGVSQNQLLHPPTESLWFDHALPALKTPVNKGCRLETRWNKCELLI